MDPIDTNKIIQIISRHIPEVVAIYLFGSAATGDTNDDSDIDLAVLARQRLDPELAYALKTDLSIAFKRDIDLVDMLDADSVTAAQVILTGNLLFQSDSKACGIFETSALGQYLQLNQERQGILDDIEMRGSIYGR